MAWFPFNRAAGGIGLWLAGGWGGGFYAYRVHPAVAAVVGAAVVVLAAAVVLAACTARRHLAAAALAAGWLAGMAGAHLARPKLSGGTTMEVTGREETTRGVRYRLQGNGKRGLRKIEGEVKAGARLWVPDDPRLPVVPLVVPDPARPVKSGNGGASLVDALTLGKKAPEKLRYQLRHAGLAHVLALSGLHMSIVVGMVLWLVRRLHGFLPMSWGVERRFLEAAAGAAFAWIYQSAVGGPVPTTRAALMITFWLVFRNWGIGGLPTSLLLSAAVLWVWDPLCLTDPSFQLSFAAVAGMALFMHGISPGETVRRAAAACAGASLATLPLVWWHFGRVSPLFPVNNLLFLPLFSLFLIPAAFLAQAVAQFFALPFAGVPRGTLDALSEPAAGALQAWNTLWPEWMPAGAALWTAALCTGLWWGCHRKKGGFAPALAVLAAMAVFPWGRENASTLRFSFFARGGESVLIRFPHGENWLIDAGAPRLAGELARRGVVRLHRVILTHNHADHMQEIFRLAETLPVDTVWVSPRFPENWRRRLQALRVSVQPVPLSSPLPGGCLRLRSLQDNHGARAPSFWSENDASLAVELLWRGRRFWFMGDAENRAEQEIARTCTPGAADLVKIAHHGRATSSSPAIWSCLRPRLAVICTGPADPGVVRRLQNTGARVVLVENAWDWAVPEHFLDAIRFHEKTGSFNPLDACTERKK